MYDPQRGGFSAHKDIECLILTEEFLSPKRKLNSGTSMKYPCRPRGY